MAALPVPNYQRSDNPLIGYEYIPNYEPSDAPFDPSHAGFRTISEGFRDHAYPRKKPDDTYRIVVLRRQPQRAALPPLAAMPEAAVMEIPLAAATYPSRATPKAKLDHPPARYTAEH
jgi:hypothetical protein